MDYGWAEFAEQQRLLFMRQAERLRTMAPEPALMVPSGARAAAIDHWRLTAGRQLERALAEAGLAGDKAGKEEFGGSRILTMAQSGVSVAAFLCREIFLTDTEEPEALQCAGLFHAFVGVADGLFDADQLTYRAHREALQRALRPTAWVAGGRANGFAPSGSPQGSLLLDLARQWITRGEQAPCFRDPQIAYKLTRAAAAGWRALDGPTTFPRLLRSSVAYWVDACLLSAHLGHPPPGWRKYRRLVVSFGIYGQWLDDLFDLGIDVEAGTGNLILDTLACAGYLGDRSPQGVSNALGNPSARKALVDVGFTHCRRFLEICDALPSGSGSALALVAESIESLEHPMAAP